MFEQISSLLFSESVPKRTSWGGNFMGYDTLPLTSFVNTGIGSMDGRLHSKDNNPYIPAEIVNLRKSLEQRGWCFVENNWEESKINHQSIQNCYKELDSFLRWKSQKVKDSFRWDQYPHNRLGYFTTERKEGYRLMTGSFAVASTKTPPEIRNSVINISQTIDSLCRQFYWRFGEFLFPQTNTEKRKKIISTIPLLTSNYFGLLDFVKYHCTDDYPTTVNGFKSSEIQVSEHIDPGLFSLSFGSTSEGLQMWDPVSQVWVDVPNDMMVLWCGKAAETLTDNQIIAGKHRVLSSKSNSRITCWYEVCTENQIPEEYQEEYKKSHDHVQKMLKEKLLAKKEVYTGIPASKSLASSVFNFPFKKPT